MKEYVVKTVSEPVEWGEIEREELEQCKWSPNPAPKAYVQSVFIEGKGLIVHIESMEKPARAENYEPDSAVWEDSCLEFFFSDGGEKYVNLEVNANAALRASIGKDRHERTLLLNEDYTMPQVSAVEEESSWQVFFFVPGKSYEEFFNKKLESGSIVMANFYSCGDKTPAPHYAAWNEVDTSAPDFHRPEFFGKLIIS